VFLDWGYGRRGHRSIAEFRERFAGEKNIVFRRTGWTCGSTGLAITAAFGTIAAEVAALTALVKATAITTSRLVASIVAFAALWSGIFRRGKIAPAGCSGTSATTAATSTTPTSTGATTVSAAITTTVSAIEIAAATVALRRTAGVARRRLELSRVVLRREILWRRFVRIGLAFVVKLFGVFGVALSCVFTGGVNFLDVRTDVVIFRIGVFAIARNYGWRGFLRAAERFAREKLNGRRSTFDGRGSVFVTVAMIVVTVVVAFEVFENVANV